MRTPRRRLFAAATAALALLAPLVPAVAAQATPAQPVPTLQLLGHVEIPPGGTFQGTTVGGLSSISYDEARGVYYALSDDRSALQPARFYTMRIDTSHGSLSAGDISFTAVTTLRDPSGQPYPLNSLDPEGMVLTPRDTLMLTSEGDTSRLIDPFIREIGLDGYQVGELALPAGISPTADHSSGVRNNLGFEPAAVTPDGKTFVTGLENALYQDGPAATLTNGSRSRLLQYDLRTGALRHEYAYDTDPIADTPVPPTAFAVNGLDELLPLDDHRFLAMERSFSVGVGNRIKIYEIDLRGATDVAHLDALAGVDTVRPVSKRLVLDVNSTGLTLDNLEGLTYGPTLPDGRRSLLVISDDNFDPAAVTQLLLFAIDD